MSIPIILWRRSLRVAFALFVLVFGAVGLLHVSAGRSLMRRMGASCPVRSATPASAARARAIGVAALRAGGNGPTRPALGFRLDASREDEIASWAARVGATCARRLRGFTFVDCRPRQTIAADDGAPGAGVRLETTDLLTFAFGPTGTLTSVDLFRRPGTEAEAARAFQTACDHLAARLGLPAESAGTIGDVTRTRQPMATALVRYRFQDYLANVTAVRLPSGLVVREQYQSAL